MNQACERCGGLDHTRIRVERPFPKFLRQPKFILRCNDCGIPIATEGGNVTTIGRLALWAFPVALFDILAYLCRASPGESTLGLIALLAKIAFVVRLCLLFYQRKFSGKR